VGASEPIPADKGIVHIRTLPDGATIQVGNRIADKKTPVRWPAAPAVYQIVLKLDGYKTVTRTVRVEAGKVSNIDEILEKQK
jgi:hypothetical protein